MEYMRNHRRLVCFLMSIIIICLLAACDNTEKPTSSSPTGESPGEHSGEAKESPGPSNLNPDATIWEFNDAKTGEDIQIELFPPEETSHRSVPKFGGFVYQDYNGNEPANKRAFTISDGSLSYEFDFTGMETPGDEPPENYVITGFYLKEKKAYFFLYPQFRDDPSDRQLYIVKAELEGGGYEAFEVQGTFTWPWPTPLMGALITTSGESFIVADSDGTVYEIKDDFKPVKVFEGGVTEGTAKHFIRAVGFQEGYLLVLTQNPSVDYGGYTCYAIKDGEVAASRESDDECYFEVFWESES